ncbi:MAG: DUF3857 domain-containing protein [Candidatus Pacebacteria bacterium]|nr:DUF3857 domain-containing protein [Candidatus Paceibacterota bacterium]
MRFWDRIGWHGFRTAKGVLLVFGCFLSGAALRGDTIVLRDGREYEGKLEEATPDAIVFRQDGETVRYERTQVVHLHLQRQREWHRYGRVGEIPDELLRKSLELPTNRPEYRGAGMVTLAREITVRLRSAQTWGVNTRNIIRILNEHGEDASIRDIIYRPDVERVNIRHGISIRSDGTVVHLKDSAVQDESLYPEDKRYNILRRRRFALPEGKPGVVLDVATVKERTAAVGDQRYFQEFLLGDIDPLASATVSIFVPEGTPFRWQMLNDPSESVSHRNESVDGGVWYYWKRDNTPKLFPEPMMPPWKDVIPRLVVSADGRSWKQLSVDSESRMRDAVSRVTDDLPSPPADTVHGLWEFVSQNVQQVDVPLSASGYTPRPPAETWKLRSGSPLDRTFLFYAWLHRAGLDGDWAWLRGRSQGALAGDVPGYGAFRVPAVRVSNNQNPSWFVLGDELDRAEERLADFSGAAALSVDTGLANLPVAEPSMLHTGRYIHLTMQSEGDADVTETIRYQGIAARQIRAWRRLTEKEIKNRVAQMVTGTIPNARAINYQVLGDVTKNEPSISLRITYRVARLADSGDTICSLRLPWLEFEAWQVGREDRQFPLFWSAPTGQTVNVTIDCPKRFALAAEPDARTSENDVAQFRFCSERRNASGTEVTVSYARTVLSAEKSQYADFKQCLETRAAAGRQYWLWQK